MPNAGAFPTVGFDWDAEAMESKPGLPVACVASKGVDWKQYMHGSVALETMRTPTFVLNSLYNWCAALFEVGQCKSGSPLAGKPTCGMGRMASTLESCKTGVHAALEPAWDPSTPHGIFADACDVHVESSVGWGKVSHNSGPVDHMVSRINDIVCCCCGRGAATRR